MHDNNHDYCISAFRLYSMCGCPGEGAISELCISDPSIDDLSAVSKTIDELMRESDGRDVLNCVRAVYFTRPSELTRKGTVTLRVRKASDTLAMSEATVYRNLQKARRVFARNRGLRDEEDEAWLINLFSDS